jgi:hypothetical protein
MRIRWTSCIEADIPRISVLLTCCWVCYAWECRWHPVTQGGVLLRRDGRYISKMVILLLMVTAVWLLCKLLTACWLPGLAQWCRWKRALYTCRPLFEVGVHDVERGLDNDIWNRRMRRYVTGPGRLWDCARIECPPEDPLVSWGKWGQCHC